MSDCERKFEMSRTVTKDKIDIREHSVIRCTAVMIAAAVISMSTVLGKPSPFAASFAAAMSGIDCISAFVGSVAGYILGTSIALAAALKKVGFDLVIAGRQAIDGDTAQVGPQTAERLDIPQITYVDEILEVKEDSITVKRSLEDVEQIVTAKLPCVITTLSGMNKPRYMQCDNIVDLCKEDKIEVLTNAELGIDPETVGFKGSPTSVKTTFTKDVTDKTEVFTLSEQETADMIAKTLKEKQIITK